MRKVLKKISRTVKRVIVKTRPGKKLLERRKELRNTMRQIEQDIRTAGAHYPEEKAEEVIRGLQERHREVSEQHAKVTRELIEEGIIEAPPVRVTERKKDKADIRH